MPRYFVRVPIHIVMHQVHEVEADSEEAALAGFLHAWENIGESPIYISNKPTTVCHSASSQDDQIQVVPDMPTPDAKCPACGQDR